MTFLSLLLTAAVLLGLTDAQMGWNLDDCPTMELDSSSNLKGCAYKTFPLDRENDPTGVTVNSFTRMFYTGDAPTDDTLVLIEGGPGFSNHAFIPIADFLLSLNPAWTIYLQDHRGTGLSSPVNCAANPSFYFNPYNTTEYVNCNDYVISNFGAVSAHYNTYNAARDLKETIDIINPPKVGIYALSYGTYFTNTYMQIPGARYDAVILDGPLPPGRWLMEFNALWNSQVSQDLIGLCVRESSVCQEAFDSMGHYPRLIMDQLIDGSLACLDKLPWLREEDGVHLVRTYNNYLTASKDAQVLMGPFWHRMLRCTDADAAQLTTFHNQRVAADTYRSPTYDYSYGLGINILASELYSLSDQNSNSPLTYEDQLVVMSRLFSDGGGQYSSSFARDVSLWPRYSPPSISRSFASPTAPVLILAGTLDPNTQFGLGKWYRDGLGAQAELVEVPYATHGTLTATDTCVHRIFTDFFTTWGASANTSCISSGYYSLPDFDGSEAPAQWLSEDMFGTADVWNNGFLKDVNVTSNNEDTATVSSSDCNWEDEDVEIVLGSTLGAALLVVCLIVLFFTMKWAPKTSDGLMSDSKL